jgi:hypothetical protein
LAPNLYVFTVVCSGFAALEALNNAEYNVIILRDLEEELCGDSLMRIVRNIGFTMPVTLMTQKEAAAELINQLVRTEILDSGAALQIGDNTFDSAIRKRIRNRGYSSVLFEPYSADDLVNAVTAALEHPVIEKVDLASLPVPYTYFASHSVSNKKTIAANNNGSDNTDNSNDADTTDHIRRTEKSQPSLAHNSSPASAERNLGGNFDYYATQLKAAQIQLAESVAARKLEQEKYAAELQELRAAKAALELRSKQFDAHCATQDAAKKIALEAQRSLNAYSRVEQGEFNTGPYPISSAPVTSVLGAVELRYGASRAKKISEIIQMHGYMDKLIDHETIIRMLVTKELLRIAREEQQVSGDDSMAKTLASSRKTRRKLPKREQVKYDKAQSIMIMAEIGRIRDLLEGNPAQQAEGVDDLLNFDPSVLSMRQQHMNIYSGKDVLLQPVRSIRKFLLQNGNSNGEQQEYDSEPDATDSDDDEAPKDQQWHGPYQPPLPRKSAAYSPKTSNLSSIATGFSLPLYFTDQLKAQLSQVGGGSVDPRDGSTSGISSAPGRKARARPAELLDENGSTGYEPYSTDSSLKRPTKKPTKRKTSNIRANYAGDYGSAEITDYTSKEAGPRGAMGARDAQTFDFGDKNVGAYPFAFSTMSSMYSAQNKPNLQYENPYVRNASATQGLTRRQLLTLEAQNMVANWDNSNFRIALEPAEAGLDKEVDEAAHILAAKF